MQNTVYYTITLKHVVEANCNNIETGKTYSKVSNDYISVKIETCDPMYTEHMPECGYALRVDELLPLNIAKLFLDIDSESYTAPKDDNWSIDENGQEIFYMPEHFRIIIENQLAEGFDGIDVEKLYNAFRHRQPLEEE